jgi:Uma2 family endonuclease
MSVVTKQTPLSIEDYLNGELASDVRHEYVSGAIYAMVGASTRHNLLCVSLTTALQNHLGNSDCHTFQSDMKVRVNDIFYYPDIVVVCDKVDLASYYQTNPILIIEVLSETTEAKDRLEKRVVYQRMPSLKEYVLVSQDKVNIEIYRRNNNEWELEIFNQYDLTVSSWKYLQKKYTKQYSVDFSWGATADASALNNRLYYFPPG